MQSNPTPQTEWNSFFLENMFILVELGGKLDTTLMSVPWMYYEEVHTVFKDAAPVIPMKVASWAHAPKKPLWPFSHFHVFGPIGHVH